MELSFSTVSQFTYTIGSRCFSNQVRGNMKVWSFRVILASTFHMLLPQITTSMNIPKKTLMEKIKSWISSPYYMFGGIFEGLRTRNCYKTRASRGNKYTSVLDFKFHSDFISMQHMTFCTWLHITKTYMGLIIAINFFRMFLLHRAFQIHPGTETSLLSSIKLSMCF